MVGVDHLGDAIGARGGVEVDRAPSVDRVVALDDSETSGDEPPVVAPLAVTVVTRASGGGSSTRRRGQLGDSGAESPSTSMSTPELSLRTVPAKPRATACR